MDLLGWFLAPMGFPFGFDFGKFKKKMGKKFFVIGSLLGIALGLGYLVWGGLEENLVYFLTPAELEAKGKEAIEAPARLGGVVSPNTVRFDSGLLTFQMEDNQKKIEVVTTKAPPQMFQEGMGVIVEGALQADGRFRAERLMVKHGNEYRPPKEGEMPREIYRQLRSP